MNWQIIFVTLCGLIFIAPGAGAIELRSDIATPSISAIPVAGGCKSVSTCEEAVQMWCGGYTRADGDGDGIPCENVCSSKDEVDQIKAEIGC